MEVLAESVKIRYRQEKGESIEMSQDLYQGDYIKDIAKRLIKEGKDIDSIDFKQEAVKDILHSIESDLKDFGVEFDSWFSEGK